jgi:hypothetical protein
MEYSMKYFMLPNWSVVLVKSDGPIWYHGIFHVIYHGIFHRVNAP